MAMMSKDHERHVRDNLHCDCTIWIKDNNHCRGITGTESMCYNGYRQRCFLAENNSRRDIALENLRDTETTKYAELYWASPTDKTVALVKPSGGTKTDDNPETDAKNPFAAGSIVIADGPPAVGYHTVYTPKTVFSPIFDLRNDANDAAGYNQIRYIANGEQLIEVSATAVINATTTERTIVMSVYKNDKLVDTNLREIAVLKSDGTNNVTTNMELVFQTTVIKNDLLKLVLWRTDSSGSVDINFAAAGLRISTLP